MGPGNLICNINVIMQNHQKESWHIVQKDLKKTKLCILTYNNTQHMEKIKCFPQECYNLGICLRFQGSETQRTGNEQVTVKEKLTVNFVCTNMENLIQAIKRENVCLKTGFKVFN